MQSVLNEHTRSFTNLEYPFPVARFSWNAKTCQPLLVYLLFSPSFFSIVSFSVAQLRTLTLTSPTCIPRKTRKRCECLKDGGKLEIRSNIVSLAIGSQQHHQGLQFQMDHPNWDTIPSVVSKSSAKWNKNLTRPLEQAAECQPYCTSQRLKFWHFE